MATNKLNEPAIKKASKGIRISLLMVVVWIWKSCRMAPNIGE